MPSSGVGGPCDHCQCTTSCCWRRGPPSKPTLCNACGSRWLVKKNLDGYVPIQQRVGGIPRSYPKPGPKRKVNMSQPASHKPNKRGAAKILDPSTWCSEYDDSEDSEGAAYPTSSAAPTHAYTTHPPSESPASSAEGSAGVVGPGRRSTRSLLGEPSRSSKLLRISTEKQMQGLCNDPAIASLLEPRLRLKPRKPIRPSISVVF